MIGGPPARYDGSQSLDVYAKDFYVVICVFTPLTTIAILLRFYARRRRGSYFAADDLWALICYLTYIVFTINLILGKLSPTPKREASVLRCEWIDIN
jgi:hypothetical protein